MVLTSSSASLECLTALSGLTVTVFGDFSLDAYWDLRPDTTQISVETGLPVREVAEQRYSLGAAGNVAVNLRSLGVGRIRLIGICGDDPFGRRMVQEMDALGLDRAGIQILPSPWESLAYAKPYVGLTEESRIDFGSCGELPEAVVDSLIGALTDAAENSAAVIVNQQIRTGLFSSRVLAHLRELVAAHRGVRFVVDSRDLDPLWPGAVLKVNTREACRLLGQAPREDVSDGEAQELAQQLSDAVAGPVFLTRGDLGMVVAEPGDCVRILPVDAGSPVDPVGAGDAVTATVASVLATGESAVLAGQTANLAAAVSVRELRSTGAHAVTPAAILAAQDWDSVYEPELAADPTRARTIAGSDFEAVVGAGRPGETRFTHAIFDHDGTLSTLREGWEAVMAPMMMKAILGPAYGQVAPSVVAHWQQRIAEFIDRTTGIQTLVQMQGLVGLVREAGFVPADEVLDHHGYKAIYNELLLAQVRSRVAKLRSGQLSPEDFHIKNTVPLLRALRDAGITLHLASGTDEQDVIAEAGELGFGEFFENRIYGSIGEVSHEAKRVVIERIIAANQLTGAEIITFGDGPVEMRETRRRGGFAVGVSSDELRRHGMNPEKRRRLIRGGAHLLVGDYSNLTTLLDVLGIQR